MKNKKSRFDTMRTLIQLNKKGRSKHPFCVEKNKNYLFITYIVTSKPKRISVAAGVVHIIISLS